MSNHNLYSQKFMNDHKPNIVMLIEPMVSFDKIPPFLSFFGL